ncbi:hypothetical protein [Microvirga rosea]|uniref:hypothetical protein n=1 Tax=Microvirga rosea TaxID=2715425 RepID=UPI001D0ABE0C|nr:hypothetical protein [Microvirga rosea]MCB8820398.1 hypothetical protein [Microvirga rosea]
MPGCRRAFVGRIAGLGIAAVLLSPAVGQESSGTPSNPLFLTVKPSGYEADTEAQARQERLLKRMEQADYSVRSICVNCGDAWKHQTYAPFNPLQSLQAPHPTDD